MFEKYIPEFLALATVHLMAAAAPGPDFALVIRQSIVYDRITAIQTSLGIALGFLTHVTYTLLGLSLVISKSIIAFTVMKYVGAVYLIYIGISSLRSQPQVDTEPHLNASLVQDLRPGAWKAIRIGFLTNAFNPKVTLFFLSIFTAIVKETTPGHIKLMYGGYMTLQTFLWFAMVSFIFSNSIVRGGFKRMGHWFERVMGTLFIALGLKLAFWTQR